MGYACAFAGWKLLNLTCIDIPSIRAAQFGAAGSMRKLACGKMVEDDDDRARVL